jgi:hypothetical protein
MAAPATPPAAFDAQPTLVGELVTLRPLRPDDREALWAVARDPLIWEQHPDQTRHTPEGFARFFAESLDSCWALIALRTGSDEVIGQAPRSSRWSLLLDRDC